MNASQQTEAAALKERAYSRREVADIIRSVLVTIDKNNEPASKLHSELSTIAAYIENMRSELAQLRSPGTGRGYIPAASDELDAVVEETARATGTIMDACEKIEGIAGGLASPVNGELSSAVTSVYEACGFQDITGQRITKVVRALKHIESRVVEIIGAFGDAEQTASSAAAAEKGKGLLNGPQLRGAGATQEEIDRLLSGFR